MSCLFSRSGVNAKRDTPGSSDGPPTQTDLLTGDEPIRVVVRDAAKVPRQVRDRWTSWRSPAGTTSAHFAGEGARAPRPAQPGSTFVTLTRHGELRGCIGSLQAYRPLDQDVRAPMVASSATFARGPGREGGRDGSSGSDSAKPRTSVGPRDRPFPRALQVTPSDLPAGGQALGFARHATATGADPSRNEMSVMGGIIPGQVDGANHPAKPWSMAWTPAAKASMARLLPPPFAF